MANAVAANKEPMHVHCGDCAHEWICAYLPMPIKTLAPLMKAPCPMCGGKKVLHGIVPRETPEGDPIAWLTNGDTGTSSMTIWSVMTGRPIGKFGANVPYDPDDFGRCYLLLKIMPSWRGRLGEVASRYPRWASLVDAWDELTALYEEELPNKTAPKLYHRMQVLLGSDS